MMLKDTVDLGLCLVLELEKNVLVDEGLLLLLRGELVLLWSWERGE